MTALLQKLPFFDRVRPCAHGSVTIQLKPFRILVWVALCKPGPIAYDPKSWLVPTILDTGFNGAFCIREEQLQHWAGIDPNYFSIARSAKLARGLVDVRAANIWLLRNVPMSTDPICENPFRMEIDEGIHVFRKPSGADGMDARPEYPLLGMRALRRNSVVLTVDFRTALVMLQKPHVFHWPMSL